MSDRVLCKGCGWAGPVGDTQIAPHPFIDGDTIHGCPSCGEVKFVGACDVSGCREASSMGWIGRYGYRVTCQGHGKEGSHE